MTYLLYRRDPEGAEPDISPRSCESPHVAPLDRSSAVSRRTVTVSASPYGRNGSSSQSPTRPPGTGSRVPQLDANDAAAAATP